MIEEIRQMPHAVGSEKSVLSIMLQYPAEFIPAAIEEGMTESHFHGPGRGELFKFITGMFSRGESIDLVFLVQKLLDNGLLERVGGPSSLADIHNYSPATSHFANHTRILREKAILRDIIIMGINSIESAYASPDEAMEVLSEVERNMTKIVTSSQAGKHQKTLREIMGESIAGYESRVKSNEAEIGIPTGTLLDDQIKGLHPGRVVVICAYPKGGKSVLSSQIALNVVELGFPALFITMEMSEREIMDRMIIQSGRIPAEAFTAPRSYAGRVGSESVTAGMMKAVMKAIKSLSQSKIQVVRPANRNLSTIISIIRRAKRENNIALAVIDYAQLVRVQGLTGVDEVAHISHAIQELAQELGIAIILPSQLNADGDTKNGRVFEEDAAAVINIVQDRNKESETYNQHRHVLIVADRFHGSGGTRVPMILDRSRIRFVEGADETNAKSTKSTFRK